MTGRTHVLDTISLRPTDRLAHTEFAHRHLDLIKHVTGVAAHIPRDFLAENSEYWQAVSGLYEALDFQLIWPGPLQEGPVKWKELGRVTDMGHGITTERHTRDRYGRVVATVQVDGCSLFE